MFEAVVAAEGLEPVILVAQDMGQSVGLALMARQDERGCASGSSTRSFSTAPPWSTQILLEQIAAGLHGTSGPKFTLTDEYQTCQSTRIRACKGDLVMGRQIRYLAKSKDFYDRWVGILAGIGHWPSLKAPEFIADAILHRLPSV